MKRFSEVIEDQGPEPATMGFFRAICSCRGKKILSNQELCLRQLIQEEDNREALLMETIAIPIKM